MKVKLLTLAYLLLVLTSLALVAAQCGAAPQPAATEKPAAQPAATQEAAQPAATEEAAQSADDTRFKGQVIRALAFEGYTDEALVKDFEEKYGVKIESVFVYSNEDIFSNLRAGGGKNFDLVTPTSDIWPKLIEQGLVQPIDTSKLTNYQDLTQAMRELPGTSQDGKVYGVPFSWGADVLVYNTEDFPEPPQSYEVLFDEKYSGKIGGWDNAASLAITGLYMGYETPFSTEAEQLAKVKEKLCQQFPLVRLYAGQISDYVNAFQSGDISLALSGGTEVATALHEKGAKNIDWVIPKEGTLAWVDGLFIAKGAKNPELVQMLIDHMVAPKAQAQLHLDHGYGLSNPKAYDLLPPEKVEQLKRQDPGQNTDKRFEPWSPVEDYDLWVQTWNEVKAGCQ